MKILQRLSRPFVVFVERFYPDPFVFVIILTFLSFGLVFAFTDTSALEAVEFWGNGLGDLLGFMGALSITLITAHALAHTDAVGKMLKALARIPKTEVQAYVMVVLISGVSNLLAWSLGLVVGAIIAREVAIQGDKKNLNIHYPLLVASAYAGFVIWHMGYSGSSALFMATESEAAKFGEAVIPVTETIFTSWNMILAGITLLAIAVVCPLLRPSKEETIRIKADTLERARFSEETFSENHPKTLGDYLDNNRWLIIALGALVAGYVAIWFWEEGFKLSLNIVNWTFLAAGMLLARSPKHYLELVGNASKLVGPILLQFPFYAGLMGLFKGSGLAAMVSGGFAQVATANTLSFWAFLSAGIVNMFVPSGGGQWAVQGPIFLDAAEKLGTDKSLIVMGISYGDQWTNMIQPFWTIPLLAIAGLDMRKIMGYTFVVLVITFFTLGGGLLVLGSGG